MTPIKAVKAPAYLNLDNSEGSFAEFAVYLPESVNYTLSVRYANGSSNARNMSVLIDGTIAVKFTFASTGEWTKWSQEEHDLQPLPDELDDVALARAQRLKHHCDLAAGYRLGELAAEVGELVAPGDGRDVERDKDVLWRELLLHQRE